MDDGKSDQKDSKQESTQSPEGSSPEPEEAAQVPPAEPTEWEQLREIVTTQVRARPYLLALPVVLLLVVLSFALLSGGGEGPPPTEVAREVAPPPGVTPRVFEPATPTPIVGPQDWQFFEVVGLPGEELGEIAFASLVRDAWRIIAFNPATKRFVTLIDGPGNSSQPAWSPDGKLLAFVSDRTGTRQVFLLSSSTGEVRQLTESPGAKSAPAWMPDSVQLVFAAEESVAGKSAVATNLYRISTEGGGAERLTNFQGQNTNPRVLHDGTRLFFATDRFWPGWDISRWDIDKRKEEQVFSGTTSYTQLALSRDESRMALVEGYGEEAQIALRRFADGKGLARTQVSGKAYDPAFTPDGSRVVFIASQDGGKTFGITAMNGVGEISPLLIAAHPVRGLSVRKVVAESARPEATRVASSEISAIDAVIHEVTVGTVAPK